MPDRAELHYTDIVAHDLFSDHLTTTWADDVPPFGPAGTSFPPDMLERLAPAPHLKVLIDGFPCTSFGFVVRARG